MASGLNSRLQEMLRINSGSGSGSHASASSAKKPLVQVVDDAPTPEDADSSNQESDDEPPPIAFHGIAGAATAQAVGAETIAASPAASLAEQMMSDADQAAEEQKKREDSKWQKNASKVRLKDCFEFTIRQNPILSSPLLTDAVVFNVMCRLNRPHLDLRRDF